MSKLVNASPEEIREYFKGNGIRWVDTFDNNNVPDEIIIEFKDRIFRGDSYVRAEAIINMMAKHKRQLPRELFEFIHSKFGCNRFYNLDAVYDLVAYISGLPREQLIYNGYHACHALATVPNVSLEFAELVLGIEIHNKQKHDTINKMLSNTELEILPEVYDYILEYLKNNYEPYYLNARSYEAGNIEVKLFTVEEYVSLVSPSSIISFFDYGHVLFDKESILKSAYNTPEVIQLVVDKLFKLIELIDSNKACPLSNREWVITQTLIKDHPMFAKIFDGISKSQVEVYSRNEISWDEADKLIEAGKMKSDVLEIVLLRLDAPLWFTDKYQSKILQIIAREKSNVENIRNLMEMAVNSSPFYGNY